MLKTAKCGAGSTRRVAKYLAETPLRRDAYGHDMANYLALDHAKARAKIFGHSKDLSDDQMSWYKVMDETRRRWGKDEPPEWFKERMKENPKLKWRNYYHYIISPDPRDRPSPETVAAVADEWCQRMFGDENGYQWIYSVHDDNGNRIMHAHVIINAVNRLDGKKVHISKRMSDELARELQAIAAKHDLRTLPDLKERRRKLANERKARTEQAVRMSHAERDMRLDGRRSWVAEIRDTIDECVSKAKTYDNFISLMHARGYRVETSRRGLGFRHPDSTGHDKKVLADKLGTAYSEEGLRERLGDPDRTPDKTGRLGGRSRASTLKHRLATSRRAHARAADRKLAKARSDRIETAGRAPLLKERPLSSYDLLARRMRRQQEMTARSRAAPARPLGERPPWEHRKVMRDNLQKLKGMKR